MKRILLGVALFMAATFTANAQEFHMPKPSPTVTVNQGFSTSFIKLVYSRPGVKGRTIFGDLIPYGKIWRTGANAATTITFGQDVTIEENPVKAGTYALYTIPGKKEWTIILNKGIHNWGAAGYKKSMDVLRLKVYAHALAKKQERFRISVENITDNSADIVLAWDKTRVDIPIEAKDKKAILAHLQKALKSNKPPYGAAAKYYYSIDYKLDKALKYADLAIKSKPEAYYLYWTKAQILQKLGRHDQAVKSAKKAADKARSHPAFRYEYQRKYEDLKKK